MSAEPVECDVTAQVLQALREISAELAAARGDLTDLTGRLDRLEARL